MKKTKSFSDRGVPTSALPLFVFITFTITWGIAASYIIFPDQAEAWFGEISGSHPLFFLATWAPAIASFILVLRYAGFAGLRSFLSRLLLWRIAPAWVAFLLIGLPLVFVAGSIIKGGPILAPFPPEGVGPMISFLFIMMLLGPIEEFGWRGIAQPLLQRHMAPIWAGFVIGAIWGFWHIPAFFLSGAVQSGWSFTPFFIGNVAIAVLVTPILNNTRGSILWPMLFHWQLINPFWPDAQPYDTWILVGVAAVVVWINRHTMFSREGAVTEVITKTKSDMQRPIYR